MLTHCCKWFLILIMLQVVGLFQFVDKALSETGDAVHLRWAFVAYSPTNDGGTMVPIQNDATMQSGDHFKFFIENRSACYIYIVYFSSQNDVMLLYPPALTTYEALPTANNPDYIPPGQDWFRLDNHSGEERFYLLASASRLLDLELLLSRYAAASDDAEKSNLGKKIFSEIRSLRRKNSKFKRAPERPVSIMGQVRGMPRDQMPRPREVSDLAADVHAAQFFSKAIRIDHR